MGRTAIDLWYPLIGLATLAFFAAGSTVLGRVGAWGSFLPSWIFSLGPWVLALAFLAGAGVNLTGSRPWAPFVFAPAFLLLSALASVVAWWAPRWSAAQRGAAACDPVGGGGDGLTEAETRPGGVRLAAVLLGVATDKLLFIAAAGMLSAALPTTSAEFSAAALALGFACTTLGAFVAARRAGHRPILHGLLVGLIGFVISFGRFLAFRIAPPSDAGAVHSLAWELLGWALVFAAGFAGGSLARRRLAPSGPADPSRRSG